MSLIALNDVDSSGGALQENKVLIKLNSQRTSQVLSKGVIALRGLFVLQSPVHNPALLCENENEESDSVNHGVTPKYSIFNWNNMSCVCLPKPQSNHTVHCTPIKVKTEQATAITEHNQSN